MPGDEQLPTPVKVVAWLFILSGAGYAIEMAVAPFQGRISLQAGVLALFVGRGLLRRSEGWRRAALWMAVISAVVGVGIGTFILIRGAPVSATFFGAVVGYLGHLTAAIMCWALSAVVAWAASVLASERTKRAFMAPVAG